MLSKNNSYFDEELCLDRHYILTGYTNDQFCNELLQLSDVKYELHHYLRHDQNFDAVIFFDSVYMLHCYDQQSYDILRGEGGGMGASAASSSNEIVSKGPAGRNIGIRKRRSTKLERGESAPNQDQDASWHMCADSIKSSWEQVAALLRQESKQRVAVVLSNVDTLIDSIQNKEMAVLEELSSEHNRCIVIYLFRETSISTLLESVSGSRGAAANQWSRFVDNVLRPRIESSRAEANRVISLCTPNHLEVLNLLNYMRLRGDKKLRITMRDIQTIADSLAASCARQSWGLYRLSARLEQYISANKNSEAELSMENLRDVTGETNWLKPMDRLNNLVGLNNVKKEIENWFAQMQSKRKEHLKPVHYSRFAPPPACSAVDGHDLNMIFKGNPGTGKTTLARIMGMLYRELSLLPQGQVVECSAADLVSQYVGGSAQAMSAKVQEAMGGVLFIDEAYSLASNQHGREAIDQLVGDMSAYEGQFAVILAGYSADIDRLMRESNIGLNRRFPHQYILEDYNEEQMFEIFERMVQNDRDHVKIGDDLRKAFPNFCKAWVGGKTRKWGNAGEAQTLLTEMKKRCSARMQAERKAGGSLTGNAQDGSEKSDQELKLSTQDIPEHLRHCLMTRSQDDQEAMDEIEKMIGLKNVKLFLKERRDNIVFGAEERVPGNYIFSGAPGTGKTTVARRMGELLGHLTVLRRKINNVTECRAADLLNGTVRLAEVIEDARGGILFIDEAHQLEQNERGHAIIRELVPLLEDPEIRADTCFICAGYTAEMKRFLDVDQGLSRRFPVNHRIRFNDYTASELVQILKKMAAEHGEVTDSPEFQGYLSRSEAALAKYLERRPENFGNGGFIRDVYLPDSITARTARLVDKYGSAEQKWISMEEAQSIDDREKRTLTQEDIPKAFRSLAGPVGMVYEERDAKAELSELYGKREFVEFTESLFAQEDEELYFDDFTEMGTHYAIAGSEGTGRRHAVRVMARVRKELGFLESDYVRFVGKSDLEAGYVGQTAIKTRNVIEQAVGGTLVVVSPSSMLPRGIHDHSYGPEALGVIAGAMRDHFNDLCVVFLDTIEGMETFLKECPSVRNYLCRQFVFDDLGHEDMLNIFQMKTKNSMEFEESLNSLLPNFFLNWVNDRGGLGKAADSWGNGREIDQLIQELIQNWKKAKGTGKTRRYITKEMFPRYVQKYFSYS